MATPNPPAAGPAMEEEKSTPPAPPPQAPEPAAAAASHVESQSPAVTTDTATTSTTTPPPPPPPPPAQQQQQQQQPAPAATPAAKEHDDEKPTEATTTTTEQRRSLQPALPVKTPTEKETGAGAGAGAGSSPPRLSTQTDDGDSVNPPDFHGEVLSNDDIPSAETVRRIGEYIVLDRHGKTHTFKSLYTGRNVARRVLIIFVRHFYCGNCQEYLRTLSASIQPEPLLHLPISTFIAVIGCGDPALIDMYASATGCPYPIYADPTRKLYQELGMIKTLALGTRPAYMSKSLLKSSLDSIVQGVKQIKSGLAIRGGDQRQIGGEFLFEPVELRSPDASPVHEFDRRLERGRQGQGQGQQQLEEENNDDDDADRPAGHRGVSVRKEPEKEDAAGAAAGRKTKEASNMHSRTTSVTDNDNDEVEDERLVEEKKVTWCHRMRTTRDHAEIPELMEILGLNGQGKPIKDQKRWSRALETRKGTGLSMAGQMSQMAHRRIASADASP